MPSDVPLLRFTGFGALGLAVLVALCVFGLICAARGFWGTSRRARRLTILAAAFAFPTGLLFAILAFMGTYRQVVRLGPAATPRDLAYAYGAGLGPAFAGLLAALLIALTAGLGWARARETQGEPEPPPRRPNA